MKSRNYEKMFKVLVSFTGVSVLISMIFVFLSETQEIGSQKYNLYLTIFLVFLGVSGILCAFIFSIMGKIKITYKNLELKYERVIKGINFNGINGNIKIKYIEPDEVNPDKFSTLLMNKIYIKNNEINIDGDIVFNRIDLKQIQKIINKAIKNNKRSYNYSINATLKITISSKKNDFIILYGEYAGLYGFAYNEPVTSFSLMMNIEQINNTLNDIQEYIDAND